MNNTSISVSLFGEESKTQAFEEASKIKSTKKNMRGLFVLHYISQGCVNATQAALSAGYSKKSAKNQASALLKDIQVQVLIKKEQERLKTKLEITADYLAEEAMEMLRVAKGEKEVTNSVTKNGLKKEISQKIYDGKDVAKSIDLLGKLTGSFSETKKLEHDFSVEDLKRQGLDTVLAMGNE